MFQDLTGGRVDKTLPANAGDMGSIPDQGRFHVNGAAKPIHHNYRTHVIQLLKLAHPRAHALQQEKPPQWEVPARHN